MENFLKKIWFVGLCGFGFLFLMSIDVFVATPVEPLTPAEMAYYFSEDEGEELYDANSDVAMNPYVDEDYVANKSEEPEAESASYEDNYVEEKVQEAQESRIPAGGDAFSYRITRRKGWMIHPIYHVMKYHAGTDYGAPCGTPVHTRESGNVCYAGWIGGYGNAVMVNYGSCNSLYGHLSSIGVSRGQSVGSGQQIAISGRTGKVTGCHLHYEDCSGSRMHGLCMRMSGGLARNYPVVHPQRYRGGRQPVVQQPQGFFERLFGGGSPAEGNGGVSQ